MRIHDELAVLQAVEIRGNQEEVGYIFDLCEVKVCIYTSRQMMNKQGQRQGGLTGKKREPSSTARGV